MAFIRRWLLIGGVLVLGAGQLWAGPREQRAYAAAVAPFQDGLWSYAATNLTQFIRKYPNSTNVPAAVLWLARAEFNQGEFTDAMTTLHDHQAMAGNLADQYVYWIGEAQSGHGDFAAAAATLTSLPRDFPASALQLTAVVEAAAAYARLGDWPRHDALLDNPDGVFQRAAQRDPGNPLVLTGQLARENSKFQQRDFSGVLAVYSRLTNAWPLLNQQQRGQAIYLEHLAEMELGDFAAALAAATNLVQIASLPTNPDWLATAWAAQGAALLSLGRTNEAVLAYQQNLLPGTPGGKQQAAILEIAALAVARENLTNAVTVLEKFLNQFPAAAESELALLTLGELQLKASLAPPVDPNQLAAVCSNFNQFITAYPNSSLIGRAYLDRGWCEWLGNQTNAALTDFSTAAQRLPASPEQALAIFKSGDAWFMAGDFTAARRSYQTVLNGFAGFPEVAKSLGDRALYQILRADLELKDADGAEQAMRQLLQRLPAGPLAESGALLLGEAFSDFGRPEQARAVFQQFAGEFPDSPLRPQVDLAVARTFEPEGNWSEAITNYEGWLTSYPTNNLRPSVEYALGRANYSAGRETNAFQIFTAFIARFPADRNAPLAQWWVADHFFRLGGASLLDAEKNYELIFQTPGWTNAALNYAAQLMAGRAAAGRQDYQNAANYLVRLLADTNCPPPLMTQAMFAYGGVLMSWDLADTNRPFANYELATNVFMQILQANPTNNLGALAGCELAKCYRQLMNYFAATNAFAQVFNSPYASVSIRSEAKIAFGSLLEKIAAQGGDPSDLLRQARDDCYLAVFYPDSGFYREGESPDAFWMRKAGVQALPLIKTLGVDALDKFIDRIENLFPQLTDSLEKKRTALVN